MSVLDSLAQLFRKMGNCHGSSKQENSGDRPTKERVVSPPSAPVKKAVSRTVSNGVLGRETEDIKSLYKLGRELGRGQFGVTYLCTEKETGKLYACKSIAKRKLQHQDDVEDVKREIAILHHLTGCPNIVTMKGAYEDKHTVYIVMELCEGGELFDRIVGKKDGHYSEKGAAAVFREIVKVVDTCHSHGVIHRDLKPENFLMTNKSESASVKATDFGLSAFFRPGEKFRDIVGSAYYVAPEVLHRNYGHEADIWSCGVILYILLCGVPPFWAETEDGIFEAIKRGRFEMMNEPWPSISKGAKDLIINMLKLDVSQRFSIQKVQDHPWLKVDGEAPDKPLDPIVLSRLKQFSTMNKMKKVALNVIAKNLSEEEIRGLKQLFKAMDVDRNGIITLEELRAGLEKHGSIIAADQAKQLMDSADLDQSGTIDIDEFITATINLHQAAKEQHLEEAFRFFDADHSGFITVEELKQALEKETLNEGELESILKEVDTSQDGKIDYQEFVAMFSKPQTTEPTPKRTLRNPFNLVTGPPKKSH